MTRVLIKISSIVSIAVFLFACHNDARLDDRLILSGEIAGMPDSTMLFIDSDSVKDSAFVNNGKFRFEIPDQYLPLRILLHTKDFKNYKFLWLDGQSNQFTSKVGNFKDAELAGSETHRLYDLYTTELSPLRSQFDSMKSVEKVDSNVRNAMNAIHSKYIKRYQGSVLSGFILNSNKEIMPTDSVRALLKFLPKSSKYYSDIQRFLDLKANVNIGQYASDFKQIDASGRLIALSDFKGKVVLIEFWASWCGPCVRENPKIEVLQRIYRSKGFVVVGVSLDTKKENWLKAIQRDSLTWVNLSDLNGSENAAAIKYGVLGIPDNFLIDRRGVIVKRNLRGLELEESLREIL